MNQCRGQWFKRGNTMMMPLWHPGSLLRSPLRREICVEYLRKVKEVTKRQRGDSIQDAIPVGGVSRRED